MKFICKKCGSTDYKIIEKSNGRGIATGLYCAKCGQWQKWLNKQEKVLFANDINSTAEVDVLKRDVENLTRTLEEVNEEYRALQAENVALQKRLENAVELNAKVGDTVYMPWVYDGVSDIAKLHICSIIMDSETVTYAVDCIVDLGDAEKGFVEKYKHGRFAKKDFGKIVFTDYTEAEARLKEIVEDGK